MNQLLIKASDWRRPVCVRKLPVAWPKQVQYLSISYPSPVYKTTPTTPAQFLTTTLGKRIVLNKAKTR